jgi:hypothetical protein
MNKVPYVAVAGATILANGWAAAADFTQAGFVLKNMDELGVPRSTLGLLGALKAAGAAGMLLGLLGNRTIGKAAATGLIVFFVGAIATHVRARVLYNVAFPMGYLALAAASLSLSASE